MERGWNIQTTDTFGYPAEFRDSVLMLPVAIGFLPMKVGPGIPTIPGDGQHSIMVAGITIMTTVGFGFLMMNGALPGYRGGDPPDITVGLL